MKQMLFLSLFSPDEFKALQQKGSPEYIEKLYLRYNEIVFNFLFIKLKGDRTVADDLLHETFEIVLKAPFKIKSQKNLKSWLLNIAYKRLLLYFRKNNYEKNRKQLLKNELKTVRDEPYEILREKEKYLLIELALDKIRPDYRIVFEMKYMKELPQKTIAELLDKTEGAVEQLLIRARKAIKKEISKLDDNYFQKGGIEV